MSAFISWKIIKHSNHDIHSEWKTVHATRVWRGDASSMYSAYDAFSVFVYPVWNCTRLECHSEREEEAELILFAGYSKENVSIFRFRKARSGLKFHGRESSDTMISSWNFSPTLDLNFLCNICFNILSSQIILF